MIPTATGRQYPAIPARAERRSGTGLPRSNSRVNGPGRTDLSRPHPSSLDPASERAGAPPDRFRARFDAMSSAGEGTRVPSLGPPSRRGGERGTRPESQRNPRLSRRPTGYPKADRPTSGQAARTGRTGRDAGGSAHRSARRTGPNATRRTTQLAPGPGRCRRPLASDVCALRPSILSPSRLWRLPNRRDGRPARGPQQAPLTPS